MNTGLHFGGGAGIHLLAQLLNTREYRRRPKTGGVFTFLGGGDLLFGFASTKPGSVGFVGN